MNKIKLAASLSPLLSMLAFAGAATAQSINYDDLQQMFNEPVTTSATGSPQRSTEAPVSMEIISAEDIERSGATDIPTILSRVAGIDVLTWAAGGASDVGVRGYATPYSPRLLVLINGRQVYLDHYGYTAWSTLPVQLSEIRQIEVIKGPNSALFGFNAVSGVVNIITYNPKYDHANKAEVSGGTAGFGEVSLVTTLKLSEQVQTRISAGASQEKQWKNDGQVAPQFLIDPYKTSANIDTVVQVAPSTELRFEASWSNVGQTDVLPTYSYSRTKYLTNSVKGALNSETPYGLVSVDAYHNGLVVKYQSASGPLNYKNDITVLKAEDLFKLGSAHTFRAAVEYRHNELNTQPIAGGTISYDVFAASGMWNWAVTSKLATTLAVRYDDLELSRSGSFPAGYPLSSNALYSKSIGEATVNAGAVYKATPIDSFRASFARGVQVPTLVELGGINIPYPVGPYIVPVIGEPNVKPTIVTSYELAYDRLIPNWDASAGIVAFYQKTEDLKGLPTTSHLDLAPTATTYPAIFFADNVGSSELTGVELRAKGKLEGGYRWSANWTFTKATVSVIPGESVTQRQIDFANITPSSRGNVSLGWSNKTWSIDGYVRYVSSFKTDINPQPVGDYVSLAGRAGYAVTPRVTAAVSVENAQTDREVQSTRLEAERRVMASLSTTW